MTSVAPHAAVSRRLALLATLASSLWLAACGGSGGGDSGTTNVRALNLTTDLSPVALYTGDTLPAEFGALTTNKMSSTISIEANTYTLNIKKSDGTIPLTGSYALGKDKHYTAVVWGRETALRLSTLPEDEDTSAIAAGIAKLRFFNATIDTGALDIFVTSTDADLGEATPTQASLTTGALSGFRDIAGATYRLRVTGAGDPNDVRLDVPAITLTKGTYATLVITAGAGGVLVNGTLIQQQDAATSLPNTNARVRMVASVPSAGNVGATLPTTTLVGSLRSPGIGPYTLVPAGNNQAVTVRVNGAVAVTQNVNFQPGADYTLLAYGNTAGSNALAVLTDDNRLPSVSTRAKIRIVNGTAGADPLTMQVDYLTQTATSNIASGAGSTYATFTAAGSSRLDVTSPTAVDPLFTTTAASGTNLLQAGGVYTVFMLGGQSAPAGRLSRDR